MHLFSRDQKWAFKSNELSQHHLGMGPHSEAGSPAGRVTAVSGSLSSKKLKEVGINVWTYDDPGPLAPFVFKPKTLKVYNRIGMVTYLTQ